MKIGILGGIGPEATGEFYLDLISKIQKNVSSNLDFPQIIINSIPAPELIGSSICDNDLEMYIRGLKDLEKHKPDFIVMVCNTIHLFFDRLQNEIDIEIIDIRKEVEKKLSEEGFNNLTVLGTPSTIKDGLYDFPNISYYNPTDKEIEIMSKSIFDFNKGKEKDKQVSIINKIAKKYIDLGSETVLLGCTEFAVMLKDSNIPKINSIEVLVDAVIKRLEAM